MNKRHFIYIFISRYARGGVISLLLISQTLMAQWTTQSSGGECIQYQCSGAGRSGTTNYTIHTFYSSTNQTNGTYPPPSTGDYWYINCNCIQQNPMLKTTYINNPNENVGIGSNAPTEKFEVLGKIKTTNLQITGGTPGVGRVLSSDAVGNASWLTMPQVTNSWQRDAANILYYDTKAYIGLKKPATGVHADYRFAVDGKLVAKSIYVIPGNDPAWADDVFEPHYTLPTLAETEAYIQRHGHLPGIPTTAEVKEKGIDIGTMDAKLLRKIEELYLHVIRLEKENIALKESLNVLKK